MAVDGIVGAILRSDWLIGGLLTIFAALLSSMGFVLQKKAQYSMMKDKSISIEGKLILRDAKWGKLLSSRLFWWGVATYVLHFPFKEMAFNYAPETTVKPLGAFEVLFNFFFSYGFIHERFRPNDIKASLVCILAIFVMNVVQPRGEPGYMINFPLHTVEHFLDSLDVTYNVGFMAYLFAWTAMLLFAIYIIFSKTLQVVKPFAWPLLVGLLGSMLHFASKIAATLVWNAYVDRPQVWTKRHTGLVLFVTVVLYVLHLCAVCEGLRQLACRFFVPATFVVSEVLSLVMYFLFFKEWDHMDYGQTGIFICAATIGSLSVLFISPVHKVILPNQRDGPNSPLLKPEDDALQWHERILAIMDEYKIKKPDAENSAALQTIPMNVPFHGKNRYFPLIYASGMILVPLGLVFFGQQFFAFVFLTLLTSYQAWKMGAHVSLFAYVGIQKMAHYESAHFEELHLAEKRQHRKEGTEFKSNVKWEDVRHFVVVPNYKEDPSVLRLTLRSIADSGVAKKSIIAVLGMEAREEGSKEKADLLIEEWRDRFLDITATYHPPGIAGEMPGKSSNTRWAAQRMLEEYIPQKGMRMQECVVTVADADSEFHSEYFAALTYHFIHQGGAEGKTPDRYLTIWQPPILHYKNYIHQPAIVRGASIIATQHELANLADPNACRAPYSTYSLSATLAHTIDGWDPDWISEDWHMCIKCFLATGGRCRVIPIFLAVMNYAPEGESYCETLDARWLQAKRHALGFSEIVFLQDHLPRIYKALPNEDRRAFIWKGFFLWSKLLMIHVVMADLIICGPFNGYLITYFARRSIVDNLDLNSWTFLVNCFLQITALVSFLCAFVVAVLLYEKVENRIVGANDPKLSILWRSRTLHMLSVIPQFLLVFPLVFVAATVSEYIAAFKTAKTHKFHYDVALKPKVQDQA